MAGKMPKPGGPARVEATRHDGDTRVNIPTAELLSFAEDQEQRPQTVLYPRDQSLDPQLVWKGKDEQDRSDLAVPAVPIYIQEQISPKAIIEDLRARTTAGRDEQLDLFRSDFNGMTFDERVEFYQHPMKWSNRMILGDSLLVMTSLAEKEGLKGQVQTIYLDPPYGIKFGSNWQVSTRKRDVRDGKAEDATRQPEQIRAFRDTWELGIHSYLSYLRDRLVVARDLLTESGSIFVQIGAENVHLVRGVMDEVLGSDQFLAQITFAKTSGSTREFLPGASDFLLWYGKNRAATKFHQPYVEKSLSTEADGPYGFVELADGGRRRMTADERLRPGLLPPAARVFRIDNLQSQSIGRLKGEGASSWFPVEHAGRSWRPSEKSRWKTNEQGMRRLQLANRLQTTDGGLYYVRYIDDFPASALSDSWTDTVVAGFASDKKYVVETSPKVVQRCLLMTTDPGDLVLDPTCGSGTTAYVAEQWGRRWITIDTSRVALALARTLLMSAKYPYFLLADTPEGQRREAELTGIAPVGPTDGDIRRGFVYKRVPHITLKSIAQNVDIHEDMTKPEIDVAIARHADTEVLYDRPSQEPKVVRVAGPFTVESLSPHRVVADGPEGESPTPPAPIEESGRFVGMILDNLRAAGVQNTVKDERLVFDALEPYPGTFLQGSGTYSEGGASRRIAVAIGPEYGTVGPDLVREAAKEAVDLFDLLVVCGFAFDARAGEQARKLGRLTVLQAKMNPDLAMGDDLLKKTRVGNLFTVFGQPDIDIRPTADGQLEVEIRGLDVFDPTTGEIRSHTTDDIAAWFIDTEYDAESFFVRHAYFTGAGDPFEKLRRALRAEVDEAAWASLYSTVSRPFPRPATGKIAVKVINHYGDEILKVYGV